MLSFITNFLAKFFSTSQSTVVVQPPVIEVAKPEVKQETKPKKRYYKPKATAMSTPVKAKPANTNVDPKSAKPAKVAKVKQTKAK